MMHSGTNWLLAAILAVGLAAAPVGLAPVGLAPAHAAGDDDDAPVARPKNPDYTRAVARIKAGDYAGALASLQKVVAAEPDNADAHNYLGYSYRNLGRYDKSLASYRRALAIKPGHRGALEYLGELYLKTGELAKAQAQLDKLDNACFFGCAEFRELKAKIANYRKRAASG
jgi:tetratricopeptide (TPR) repeat protein